MRNPSGNRRMTWSCWLIALACCGVLGLAGPVQGPPVTAPALTPQEYPESECTEVYWTGAGGDDWTNPDNWTGLEPGDDYPGDNGNGGYCVIVDDDTLEDTVVIGQAIRVLTIYIGPDMTVKVVPDGHLQLTSHGGHGGVSCDGPPSFICDGEVWISASSIGGGSTSPGKVTLDGGYGDESSPTNAPCVLNGAIRFYLESGIGAQPGILNFTQCTRLVSSSAGEIVAHEYKGLIANSFTDTFTWDEHITVHGELEIGVYIPAWVGQDEMGTIDADLPGKSIILNSSAKLAMGIYRASGGNLVIDVPVSGFGSWELIDGEIEINADCPDLTGGLQITGGVFDANADWTTSGSAQIDGTCTVDVAADSEITVDSVTIGGADGDVQATFSGEGTFKTN